ncbi:hypothetical protein BvCmsKKP012_00395 [Escherichia coli]|nr:hypothetical protein BvCmsKKP012_00395 [Escherichia coli]
MPFVIKCAKASQFQVVCRHFRIVVHHIQVFCIRLDVERCQQVIPPIAGQGNALWQ